MTGWGIIVDVPLAIVVIGFWLGALMVLGAVLKAFLDRPLRRR